MARSKKAKKNLSAAAIKLIRKMIVNVKAHPDTFNQDTFPDPILNTIDPKPLEIKDKYVCGTEFCAAGHIVFAKNPKRFKELFHIPTTRWDHEAMDVLGIGELVNTIGDGDYRIFGSHEGWPLKFRTMYRKAENLRTRKSQDRAKARAFEARWEAFIASDGADLALSYYNDENTTEQGY